MDRVARRFAAAFIVWPIAMAMAMATALTLIASGGATRETVNIAPVAANAAPVTSNAPAVERLRVEGTRFVGPNGATFRPVFASALSILRRSPAERAVVLDQFKALGFNGIRVFAGRLAWAGQSADDGRRALPALLREADARGLHVLVTAVTDSRDGGYNVASHLDAVAGILAAHPGALAECANEYYHPTQSNEVNDAKRLAAMCRAAFARSGRPWALGAPPFATLQAGRWPVPMGDFVTSHLDRGGDAWAQLDGVRALRAIQDATRRPVLNSEPIGAGEKDDPGRRLADPDVFFALGVLNRAFDIGGVFHSESGSNALPLGPVQQAAARAFVAGVAAIPGNEALRYRAIGSAGSPVASARLASAGGAVVGAYAFLARNGSAVVVILHRPDALPDTSIGWAKGWRIVERLPSRPHVTLVKVSQTSTDVSR